MDSILAPHIDGTYQKLFGHLQRGLFFHRLENERYQFRHGGSGLSLFHLLGEEQEAYRVLEFLSEQYDFCRDSTWVLKGQTQIHSLLAANGFRRRWFQRTWHYEFPESTAVMPSTLDV